MRKAVAKKKTGRKKTATKKQPARKKTAKKAPARKKAPAKKKTAKKQAQRKPAIKKAAKKPASKAAARKKAPAKRAAPAKKKAQARKKASKQPPKKAPAKKRAVKQPAKKPAAKKKTAKPKKDSGSDSLSSLKYAYNPVAFSNQDIRPEKIADALFSGSLVPYLSEKDSWHYILIRDETTKEMLVNFECETLSERKIMTLDEARSRLSGNDKAPVFIAVVYENADKKSLSWMNDLSATITMNIISAARSLEMEGVWLSMFLKNKGYAKEIKDRLQLPSKCELTSVIVLGYLADGRSMRSLGQIRSRVHFERW